MSERPAKTQISLGIRPVWSEPSLCAQSVTKDPSFLHTDSEDSDQTGRMRRVIWVFAGRTVILLVLSCRGSFLKGIFWFSRYSLYTFSRWQLGEFGSCNKTCGGGWRNRTVRCIQEYAQGPQILNLPGKLFKQRLLIHHSACRKKINSEESGNKFKGSIFCRHIDSFNYHSKTL